MIKIEITVPDHIEGIGINDYIQHALAALGYVKSGNALGRADLKTTTAGALVERIKNAETSPNAARSELELNVIGAASAAVARENLGIENDAPAETLAQGEFKPKRERGKPDPTSGRTRRSKVEIAEDAAADAADLAAGIPLATEDDGSDAQADAEASAQIADAAIIAETPSDSAEAIAQDDADEAAESAKAAETKPIQAMLLDQVRKTMGEIAKKHGLAMAARIPEYLGKPVAEFSEAELPAVLKKVATLLKLDTSDVQAMLGEEDETPASIIEKAKTETAAVAEPKTDYPATRDELFKAMFRYAKFADDTQDQTKMVFTMEDVPQIFKKAFGVEKQGAIPDDKIGEAIALIDDAIATNRFKRKRG